MSRLVQWLRRLFPRQRPVPEWTGTYAIDPNAARRGFIVSGTPGRFVFEDCESISGGADEPK